MMLFTLVSLAMQPAAEPGWTWSLYADADPVVLAEEIPDTPRLRTTFECERGSGVVEATLYREAATPAEGDAGAPGFVTLSARGAAATSELTARSERLSFSLRTDHPVFAGFAAEGRLSVQGLGRPHRIEVGEEARAGLRRFVALCG